jgi:hypothetical protein
MSMGVRSPQVTDTARTVRGRVSTRIVLGCVGTVEPYSPEETARLDLCRWISYHREQSFRSHSQDHLLPWIWWDNLRGLDAYRVACPGAMNVFALGCSIGRGDLNWMASYKFLWGPCVTKRLRLLRRILSRLELVPDQGLCRVVAQDVFSLKCQQVLCFRL